jgi:hypothetical protein
MVQREEYDTFAKNLSTCERLLDPDTDLLGTPKPKPSPPSVKHQKQPTNTADSPSPSSERPRSWSASQHRQRSRSSSLTELPADAGTTEGTRTASWHRPMSRGSSTYSGSPLQDLAAARRSSQEPSPSLYRPMTRSSVASSSPTAAHASTCSPSPSAYRHSGHTARSSSTSNSPAEHHILQPYPPSTDRRSILIDSMSSSVPVRDRRCSLSDVRAVEPKSSGVHQALPHRTMTRSSSYGSSLESSAIASSQSSLSQPRRSMTRTASGHGTLGLEIRAHGILQPLSAPTSTGRSMTRSSSYGNSLEALVSSQEPSRTMTRSSSYGNSLDALGSAQRALARTGSPVGTPKFPGSRLSSALVYAQACQDPNGPAEAPTAPMSRLSSNFSFSTLSLASLVDSPQQTWPQQGDAAVASLEDLTSCGSPTERPLTAAEALCVFPHTEPRRRSMLEAMVARENKHSEAVAGGGGAAAVCVDAQDPVGV